jgi:hypothetical protein
MRREPRPGQLLYVQLTVLIYVQSLEFFLHKTHELLFRNLAALVPIHQQQQPLGFDFASRYILLFCFESGLALEL